MERSKFLSPELFGNKDTNSMKLEEAANLNETTSSFNILEFSDEMLLKILKYLHPHDLMAISL